MSVKPSIRQVLADNLRAVIQHRRDHGKPLADAKALAIAAKMPPSTVGRWIAQENAPTIDKLDRVARALKLQAWQLLAEGFDPANPPQALVSRRDRALFNSVKTAAAVSDEHVESEINTDSRLGQPGAHRAMPASSAAKGATAEAETGGISPAPKKRARQA